MLSLLLLLACPVAYGQDANFTVLKKGDPAPFDGRLFNDEAVSKLIVDHQFRDLECKMRVDFEIGQVKAAEQYRYDVLYARSEADNERFTDVINIRDSHIKSLEKHIRPSNSHWWAIAGFTVGAGSAIGIMYAIAPGLR